MYVSHGLLGCGCSPGQLPGSMVAEPEAEAMPCNQAHYEIWKYAKVLAECKLDYYRISE